MVTVEQWRKLASELPEATERPAWGNECWRVKDKIFTSLWEEDVIGVAVDKTEREILIAGAPDKFFLKQGHDDNYNWMRVRLGAVDTGELREILVDAWRLRAPKRLAAGFEEPTEP